MKRLLLALTLGFAGAMLFFAFRNSAVQFRRTASARRDAWLGETQFLAQTELRRIELAARVQELKKNVPNPPGEVAAIASTASIATNSPVHLSADDTEKLLAELGFDWDSTGDYLIVSKDSLRKVQLDPIRDNRLSDIAAAVLAVTPAERAALDSLINRVS